MKISELQVFLEEYKQSNGDVDVYIDDINGDAYLLSEDKLKDSYEVKCKDGFQFNSTYSLHEKDNIVEYKGLTFSVEAEFYGR